MKNLRLLFVTLAFMLAPLVVRAQTGPPLYRVDTMAQLVQITLYGADTKAIAFVGGSASRNDGFGGTFFYNGTSTLATNTYSVFKPSTTAAGAAGRWILFPAQTFNQNAAATAASETTYAVHLLRNNATNVFSLGADNNNVYLQSQANYALHLNNRGNNTILNATGGSVGIRTISATPTSALTIGSFTTIASAGTPAIAIGGAPGGTFYGQGTFPSLNLDDSSQAANARNWQLGPLSSLSYTLRAIDDAGNFAGNVMVATRNAGTYTISGTAFPSGTSTFNALTVTNNLIVGDAPVGNAIRAIYSAAAQLDFASIDSFSTTNLTVTVTGAGTNSVATVSVAGGAQTGHIMLNAFVSATNTVTVRAANPTAAAIDPASTSYRVLVTQY